MLGGINNHLFFSGFGGFFVLILLLIPLMIWAFPSKRKDKEQIQLIKEIRSEIKKIKRKK